MVKTATTLFQYSGLNCSGVSTRINLMVREVSMEEIRRWVCKRFEDVLEDALVDSGGTYMPFSRNALMLDNRRSDEAEGDIKMIGSGRRTGVLGL